MACHSSFFSLTKLPRPCFGKLSGHITHMQPCAQKSTTYPVKQQCRASSLEDCKGKLAQWATAGIAALLGAALWPPHAAHALTLRKALAGPLFEPLVASEPEWLRSLVWNDFRLAVVFNVLVPMVLWIWALGAQTGADDAIKRIMFSYWQAASLLMGTVYLNIGAQPVGFLTAMAVQAMIVASVWWWKDLNQEVAETRGALKGTFVVWRWVVTALGVAGTLTQAVQTQASCTLASSPSEILSNPRCAAWLEPPYGYKEILHSNLPVGKLQLVGFFIAAVWTAYLLFYIVNTIPKTGRRARRNLSMSYKVLHRLGFYTS